MSTELKHIAVSSITSVISSIENDRQVYRWFLMFISLPEIQQALCQQNKIMDEYQRLKKIQTGEIITYVVMALIITVSCREKQPWVLLLAVLPLTILINLFRMNRGCVGAISKQFLLDNIPADELNKQTLFQTCEYLSRKYTIPSLVTIITFQDFIGRKVLLGAILILPFIYPLNSWQQTIITITIYLTTLAIVNTSIVLKKLK